MGKILYHIQKSVFRFIGDIKWAGIAHPFWFIINAKNCKLKGEHYRSVCKVIQPGDILLRRFEGYVDKWFIPGWMNHAGIYVGDVNEDLPRQVVHAVSEGVIQEDLLNFMRTDHMLILRAPAGKKGRSYSKAITTAHSVVGKPYDFGFDFKDCNRFSCTELVAHCYPGLVKGKKRFGKDTIVADDFVACEAIKTIWDSRNYNHGNVIDTFLAKV